MRRRRAVRSKATAGRPKSAGVAGDDKHFRFASSLPEIFSVSRVRVCAARLSYGARGFSTGKTGHPLRSGAREPTPSLCMGPRMPRIGAIARPKSRSWMKSAMPSPQLPRPEMGIAIGSSRGESGIISSTYVPSPPRSGGEGKGEGVLVVGLRARSFRADFSARVCLWRHPLTPALSPADAGARGDSFSKTSARSSAKPSSGGW